jgi:hypothetical protein
MIFQGISNMATELLTQMVLNQTVSESFLNFRFCLSRVADEAWVPEHWTSPILK